LLLLPGDFFAPDLPRDAPPDDFFRAPLRDDDALREDDLLLLPAAPFDVRLAFLAILRVPFILPGSSPSDSSRLRLNKLIILAPTLLLLA
jgi:hypothetical protein